MPWLKEPADTDEIEKGVNNKWRWLWLKQTSLVGESKVEFGQWLRKVDKPGEAFCIICNQPIKYGSNGLRSVQKHSAKPDHIKNFSTRAACENLQVDGPTVPQLVTSQVEKKTRLVAFAAEHHLPYSLVPEILELAKTLSDNKCKQLNRLHMTRQCATYTSTHGLAAACREDLRTKLKSSFFSFNLDEATNNNMDKIVNIVVRYFDEEAESVKTEHFSSTVVNQATAHNVHKAVVDAMKERLPGDNDEVPIASLISCMMDNCNTMRGVKNGVEVQLREDNPYLLRVAGDTAHVVCNAAKKLFEPFHNYLENIASDIYFDIQKSPKVKDLFEEVQALLGSEKPLQIMRYCPSRFLNMLDVSQRLFKLMDSLRVYYFAFLTKEEQTQHKLALNSIFEKHGAGPEAVARVKEIQTAQKKQAKTSTSESRKDRILTALFSSFGKFSLIVDIYRGVLPVFQGYVKLLQKKEPILHELVRKMFGLVRDVLILFLKRESIPDAGGKEMVSLKDKGILTDENKLLKYADIGVGEFAYRAYTTAVQKKGCHWGKEVAVNLRKGFQMCAADLLEKLPLRNPTLTRLGSLHPEAWNCDRFHSSIVNLAKNLPNVVKEDDLGKLDSQARAFSVDEDVKSFVADFDPVSQQIDTGYWAKVFRLKTNGEARYPHLTVLVKAVLSIFTGPLVESSFNLMDDIVRQDRSKLAVENYEATAIIKSYLSGRSEKASNMKVTPRMAGFLTRSKGRYGRFAQAKQQERLRRMQKSTSYNPSTSSTSTPLATPSTSSTPSATPSTSSTLSANPSTSSISSTTSSASSDVSAVPSTSVKGHPKGGKRAALKSTSDIRGFFKKPRKD